MKIKSAVSRTLIAIVMLLSALTSAQLTYARGGGAVFTYVPGQCNVGTATATAVVIKANNTQQFAIQVVGSDSVGDWTITWTKNGVFNSNTTINIPPPGGWLAVGLSTVPTDKGIISFQAVATKASGVTCSVAASVKV